MRKHAFLSLVLAVLLAPTVLLPAQGQKNGPSEAEQPSGTSPSITVYAYDSFTSEWGPGPLVVPAFEARTGIKVNLVSVGNGGDLLRRVVLEQKQPKADVVLGIADELLPEVRRSTLFLPWRPQALDDIKPELWFDDAQEPLLVPYDYGNYAFIYDSAAIENPPRSLDDLLDVAYKRSLILMDPRTSSVGMGLLQWTIRVYGEDWLSWWEAVKPNVLTIADGWSSGYGLFTQGEAPLVISYTTSPVYHVLYEDTDRYKTAIFDEGNLAVIEGVGILASSEHIPEAKQFIEFLLTEAQRDIAVANIMYPANSRTILPEAFAYAPMPRQSLRLDVQTIEKNRDSWLDAWVEAMSK